MTGSPVALIPADVDGAVVAGRNAPTARAIAGFNGGVPVNPDLPAIDSRRLEPAAAPHVAQEARMVRFGARVVAGFAKAMERCILRRRPPPTEAAGRLAGRRAR